MYNKKIILYLHRFNQKHLIDDIDKLSTFQQKQLLEQLRKIELNKMHSLNESKSLTQFSPLKECYLPKEEDEKEGEKQLSQKKMGLLILAAGQGTRLGFNKPKGMFPISNVLEKSLFQLLCEKIKAFQKLYNTIIPCAIMLFSDDFDEVLQYFKKNNFFGLDKNQLHFFSQNILPVFDDNNKWMWGNFGKIACSPDGNGSAFFSFYHEGVFELFVSQGIKYLNILAIDDPLVDPFDCSFLGFHINHKQQITIKTRKRKDNTTGLLVEENDRVSVVEYLDVQGKIDGYSYMGNFIISMSTLLEVIEKNYFLPLHKVKKKCVVFTNNQFVKKEVWKHEKFIFDIFPYIKNIGVMLAKKFSFAPLKNIEGENGIKEVKKALLEKDRQIFYSITEIYPKDDVFELSMAFHYPSKEILKKWKHKNLLNRRYIYPELV